MRGKQRAFIGVDVGTASARAGIFDATARLLATARHPIRLWHEAGDIVEQSSDGHLAGLRDCDPRRDGGGGLRRRDRRHRLRRDLFAGRARRRRPAADGQPLGRPERNVIVWMDHRAIEQAERINETGHAVLRYVGGIISPEMETPKLLWLKEHLPATYRSARAVLRSRRLSYLARDGDARARSARVTCKWTYLAHERRLGRRAISRASASATGRRQLRADRQPRSSSRRRRSAPA